MKDMPSCFTSVNRKARKQHKCCECGQQISPGDTYRYSSGIWDSVPESYKQCAICADIFDTATNINREANNYPDEGPAFGYLIEWVLEEVHQYPESISRFNFGDNPKWMKYIENKEAE